MFGMRASILVSVAALLVTGALQNEALGKVSREPTGSDTFEAGPLSDRETGAEERSARRYDSFGGQDANKTKATQRKSEDQLEDEEFEDKFAPNEGSRSVGGAPAGSPPDWLVGSWFQFGHSANEPVTDSFAGFMIRLNHIRLLTYEPTCSRPECQANSLDDVDKKLALEQLSFGLPEKINTNTGPAGTKRLFGCNTFAGVMLANNMGIFHVNLKQGWKSYDSLPKLKTKPPLQKDPNVKDDCYLYSYSGNRDSFGTEGHERTFARFKVFHTGCKESICNFLSDRQDGGPYGSELFGAVCPVLKDSAAPILCGSDKKLSFLAFPNQFGPDCDRKFKALSIADHYETISKYLNMTELPATPRI